MKTYSGRFGGDVVRDTVDARNLVCYTRGYASQYLGRKYEPVCCHEVLGLNRAQRNDLYNRWINRRRLLCSGIYAHLFVGSLVTHDTNSLNGKQNGESLADLVEFCATNFLDVNAISVL